MIDPLDPFNIGWQKRLRDVERVIDTGVGVGLGVGKVLLGSDAGTALTGQLTGNVPLTPAQFFQNVMRTIADQFLDKRIRTRAGEGVLTFTPTTLDTDVNSLGLARGQFAHIRLTAKDLHWIADSPEDGVDAADDRPPGHRTALQVHVEHAQVASRDLRLRTTYSPALEFGTIDAEVRISARELRRLVHTQQPDLTIDIDTAGVVRASWTRAQRLGHLVIVPEVVDGNLKFVPAELNLSRLSFNTRRRLPTRTLEVPELPWNLRLTDVETRSRALVLIGQSDQAEGRISTIPLAELAGLVRAAVKYAGR